MNPANSMLSGVLTEAAAKTTTQAADPSQYLLLLVGAVFIFMTFRSSQKRKKQAAEMQQQLVPGAKVMLHSGIVGRVISVSDNDLVIESAGSKLEVVRQAVRTVSVWEAKEETPAAEPEATEAAPKTPRKRAAKPAAEKTEN